VNTVKEYLRLEVQFHLFLALENDRRGVKSQLHAMKALCRLNGLQYTLRGHLDQSKSRSGGFGEIKNKKYCLSGTSFLNNCKV
jgi:hypothetical protein